ncbi:GNAT family N-acetyltransferase [Promicromonospora vindobonensis]|uniref:GNAT family N-acetyltransferase n=1 Tax=Promicromonospora vindobonensis TaxID=195748 RepID=A0ABW5VSP1_9MICO
MAELVSHTVAPGALAGTPQPTFSLENGVELRAVMAVGQWAFGVGFRRLELQHSTLNLASCRVAEKAGFGLEGKRLGAALHADGHHDMHTHARLADADHPPLRSARDTPTTACST